MARVVLPRDHILYKNMKNVQKIAKVLADDTNNLINLSIYCRQYDDRSFLSLTNNHLEDFTDHCFKNFLNNDIYRTRFQPGINYWKTIALENERTAKLYEEGRADFDIDARIDFTYRDNILGCYHIYEFYAHTKNADKAYSFYNRHRDKLFKFISYFNQNAFNLIRETDKKENRIFISDYIQPDRKATKRNYAAELIKENASTNFPHREFEVLILYAGGYTAKEIGEILGISPKTAEEYIARIRNKLGYSSRASLHKYVLDRGWGWLIQFFFPYICEE